MKTASDYLYEMESSNILMNRECTFKEYASELKQFEHLICKMVTGDQYYDKMRIEEATCHLVSMAKRKGLRGNLAVCNGISTMKKLEKEISVTLSGAKGEYYVSKALQHLNRPDHQIFENVYLTDGEEETEIDKIVLTNSGIIILEIKKVKGDVRLTETGRLIRENGDCFDDIPLSEKMEIKRQLLKKNLEKAIADKGLNIPVYIDRYIVFSMPVKQRIHVEDKYKKEKFCFRTNVGKIIDTYLGCANYNEEQFSQLGAILAEMEAVVKRFEVDIDYDEIRHNLAEALAVLNEEPTVVREKCNTTETKAESNPQVAKNIEINPKKFNVVRKQSCKAARFGYMAASVVTGILISGAVIVLGLGTHQA